MENCWEQTSFVRARLYFSLRVACLLTPCLSRVLPRDAFAPLDTFVIWHSQAVAETGCSTFGWLKIASQPAGSAIHRHSRYSTDCVVYPRACNTSNFFAYPSSIEILARVDHRDRIPRIRIVHFTIGNLDIAAPRDHERLSVLIIELDTLLTFRKILILFLFVFLPRETWLNRALDVAANRVP